MVKSLSILQSERVRAQGNSKHWKQKQTLKTKSCIILPTFTKKENIIPIKLIPHSVTSLKHYILDEDYLLHNAENGSFTGFFFQNISLLVWFWALYIKHKSKYFTHHAKRWTTTVHQCYITGSFNTETFYLIRSSFLFSLLNFDFIVNTMHHSCQ